MAKLLFDPSRLEHVVDGRRIFRPLPDRTLVRLGHPLIAHATNVYRRHLWMGGTQRPGLSRLCCRSTDLGGVADAVLVAYLFAQAVNGLGETVHQELVELPLLAAGRQLRLAQPEWWHEVRRQPRQTLEADSAGIRSRLQELWPRHRQQLEDLTADRRSALEGTLRDLAAQALAEETRRQQEVFDHAVREAREELQKRTKGDLQRKIRRLRRRAEELEGQLILALGMRTERAHIERQIAQLEELARQTEEQLQQRLEQIEDERTRVLEQVLPQRFSVERIYLWPAAVEYLVHG